MQLQLKIAAKNTQKKNTNLNTNSKISLLGGSFQLEKRDVQRTNSREFGKAQMKRKDGCGRIKLNRKRIESKLIGSQIRKTQKVNLVGLRKTKVAEICCYTNRRVKLAGQLTQLIDPFFFFFITLMPSSPSPACYLFSSPPPACLPPSSFLFLLLSASIFPRGSFLVLARQ